MKKKAIKIIIIFILIIEMLVLCLDGMNIFTETFEERNHFSLYNINPWQQSTFFFGLISLFSFVFATYFGIQNLNQIRLNDYERTKAKLTLISNQVGKRMFISLSNKGATSAKIKNINWEPQILRKDLFPEQVHKELNFSNEILFSSKINKELYPLEEIRYIIPTGVPLYEKIKDNKEYKLIIEWEDYKGSINKFTYVLDFRKEFVEAGYTSTDSKLIEKHISNMGENIVQTLKEINIR